MSDTSPRTPRKNGPTRTDNRIDEPLSDAQQSDAFVVTGEPPPRVATLIEVPKPAAPPRKSEEPAADGSGAGAAPTDEEVVTRVIGTVTNEVARAGVFSEVRERVRNATGLDIATADDDAARAAIKQTLRNDAVEALGAGAVFDKGRVIGADDPRTFTDQELASRLGHLAVAVEVGAHIDKDPSEVTPRDIKDFADTIHRGELEAVLGMPVDRATTTERFYAEQLLRNRGAGFDVSDEQVRLDELINRIPGRRNGSDDDGSNGFPGDSTNGSNDGGGTGGGDSGSQQPGGGRLAEPDIGPRPGTSPGPGSGGADGSGTTAGGPPAGSQAFDVREGSMTVHADGTETRTEGVVTYFRTPDGQWVDGNGNPVDEGTAQALEAGELGTRAPEKDQPAPTPPPPDDPPADDPPPDDPPPDDPPADDPPPDDADVELSPDPESDLVLPPGLEDVFNRFDLVGQGIAELRAQQAASGSTPDSTPDPTNQVPIGPGTFGDGRFLLTGDDRRGVDSGPPILGGNRTPSFGGQAGAIDPGPDASMGSASGPEIEFEIPRADGAASHLLDDALASDSTDDDDQKDTDRSEVSTSD